MTIQIVNETGCFMYLDKNANYMDSFFIGKYWFDLMTSKQKQMLKQLLEKNNITPLEILYKDYNVYLTFRNHKNVDCIYEIYVTGEVRCHSVEEFVKTLNFEDYSQFEKLHEFH